MLRPTRPAALLLIGGALAALPALAGKPSHPIDTVWKAPDYDAYAPRSIAVLPVATLDGNLNARRLTETALVQSMRGTGHRWVSAGISRDEISDRGGDSLLKVINDQIVRDVRLDSLQAPVISRTTHTRALLCVRVDQFEKRELDFNESGTPVTSVRVHAALVDSTGRLLWTAEGAENAEGPYQDANQAAIGVRESGLHNMPITGQGAAPDYLETLNKLLSRLAAQLPSPPAEASAAPGAK